jgi:hypothetical protein
LAQSLGTVSNTTSQYQGGLARHPTENIFYAATTNTANTGIIISVIEFTSAGALVALVSQTILGASLILPPSSNYALPLRVRPLYRNQTLQLVYPDFSGTGYMVTYLVQPTNPTVLTLIERDQLPSSASNAVPRFASTVAGYYLFINSAASLNLYAPSACKQQLTTEKLSSAPLCSAVMCADAPTPTLPLAFCPPNNPYITAADLDPTSTRATCRTVARPAGLHIPAATFNIGTLLQSQGAFGFNGTTDTRFALFDGCRNQFGCEFWASSANTAKSTRFVVDAQCNLLSVQTISISFVDVRCYNDTVYALDSSGNFYANPQFTTTPLYVPDTALATTTVTAPITFPSTPLNVVSTAGFSTGPGSLKVQTTTGFTFVSYATVNPTQFITVTGGSGTANIGFTVKSQQPIQKFAINGNYLYLGGFSTSAGSIAGSYVYADNLLTGLALSGVGSNSVTLSPIGQSVLEDMLIINNFLCVTYTTLSQTNHFFAQITLLPDGTFGTAVTITLATAQLNSNGVDGLTAHPLLPIVYAGVFTLTQTLLQVISIGSLATQPNVIASIAIPNSTPFNPSRTLLRPRFSDGVIQLLVPTTNATTSNLLATFLTDDNNPSLVALTSVTQLTALGTNNVQPQFASTAGGCFVIAFFNPSTQLQLYGPATGETKLINSLPMNFPSSIFAVLPQASNVTYTAGSLSINSITGVGLVSNFSDINQPTIAASANMFTPTQLMYIRVNAIYDYTNAATGDVSLTATTSGTPLTNNDITVSVFSGTANVKLTLQLHGIMLVGPSNSLVFNVTAGLTLTATTFYLAIEFLRFA